MDDSICLTYISKELISKSFTLGSSLYKSCNINNLTGGRNDTSRMYQLCKFCESLVGNSNYTNVGLYSTKGEVCRLSLCT